MEPEPARVLGGGAGWMKPGRMREIKAGRESGERERAQEEKGEQEISQTAYLKVKEGYSDEM